MTTVAVFPKLGYSDETISREDLIKYTVIDLNDSRVLKEIREIKARTPDLYEALAKDDPSLIK